MNAAPDDGRLGVAILGAAHLHALSYGRSLASSTTARLVGLHDASTELGEAAAAHIGCTYHADLDALIGAPDVQAVIVCSATNGHRELVERAAARGLHVLCEKPIATTLADAQAMIETCQRHGVQLHTAFVTRFYPLVQQLRTAVEAGRLGQVIGMVGGNRGRPPLPPLYPPWITTATESGGGALMDHSVHVTDVMRHVSGLEAVTVTAEVDSLLWDAGVDDVALMSLVFEGGAVASVDPSWSVPEGNPWDYDFFLRVIGTKGSMSVHDLAESLQLVSPAVAGGMRLVPFGVDIDALMVDAFVASIRAGGILSPCADGLDGLRALEIALAGYASAARSEPVSLPFVADP